MAVKYLERVEKYFQLRDRERERQLKNTPRTLRAEKSIFGTLKE